MAGILLSGPAGAGKTALARDLLQNLDRPGMVADFQSIYAALLLLLRNDDGRYPERNPSHDYLLSVVAYVRRAMVGVADDNELDVIFTNSDGSETRRAALLSLLGPGSREIVVEPPRALVTAHLSRDGVLSDQCREALRRWYDRKGQ